MYSIPFDGKLLLLLEKQAELRLVRLLIFFIKYVRSMYTTRTNLRIGTFYR